MFGEEVVSRRVCRTTWKRQYCAEATIRTSSNCVKLTGRKPFIRLVLDRMNQIRKVGAVIDEKRGHMITNQVMVTTCAIYFGCEAVSVPPNFTSSGTSDHNGEASKHIARNTFTKPTCRGYIGPVAIRFKATISSMTKSVYDTFRLPLTIKVDQLLSRRRIFQEHITSRAST